MIKKVTFAMVSFILLTPIFSGCSPANDDRLKITTTHWLGYTPLLYARSMGWLDELNIQLVQMVSLSESLYTFEAGNADALTGTQYEYGILSEEMPDLVPIIMLDRSFGGDVVLSNVSIDEIRRSTNINVYLEMDSINFLVLNDFIKAQEIDPTALVYENVDQTLIAGLTLSDLNQPTLVVTYNPYNLSLLRQGFQLLASTAHGLDLIVVDAMFARQSVLEQHRDKFDALSGLINKAISELQQDPQAFYQAIEVYMPDISFQEFQSSLDSVQWVNQGLPADVAARLQQDGFPVQALITPQ